MAGQVGSSKGNASNFTAAVGPASTITVYPGIANRRAKLKLIVVGASVSGRYQIYDNSPGNPPIYDGYLVALTPLVLPMFDYLTVGVGTAVSFANGTVGNADMSAMCVYETLATA